MPDQQPPAAKTVSLKEFFEKTPPGQEVTFKKLVTRRTDRGFVSYIYDLPVIELHCDTDGCHGIRMFEPSELQHANIDDAQDSFAYFLCRNCKTTVKTYALRTRVDGDLGGVLFKFGEIPAFGPPIPARVVTLVGPDKDYYFKGRRSENQGLGIGAFAYYRRVVENQKNRIFDEIIRVARKLGAAEEMLDDLEAARKEIQFTKAVGTVKHGIPQALLVNGHNPLTLLHTALSNGLHAQEDKECLELATSIRLVLTDLAERLSNALKEQADLNTAVSKLMSAKTQKPANPVV